MQFGNFNRKQVQMDSTGKLTKDGEWLYCFVGVFRDSGTQTDYVPDDRIVLAPSLTWCAATETRGGSRVVIERDYGDSYNYYAPRERYIERRGYYDDGPRVGIGVGPGGVGVGVGVGPRW